MPQLTGVGRPVLNLEYPDAVLRVQRDYVRVNVIDPRTEIQLPSIIQMLRQEGRELRFTFGELWSEEVPLMLRRIQRRSHRLLRVCSSLTSQSRRQRIMHPLTGRVGDHLDVWLVPPRQEVAENLHTFAVFLAPARFFGGDDVLKCRRRNFDI